MNLWIRNATIVPMTEKNRVLNKASVYIEDNTIKKVGEYDSSISADKTIDAEGKILLPGLINTHTHLGMSLFRNYADDMNLEDWLTTKIWPIEAKLSGEDIYYGSLLSMAEMIASGTTTYVDMYYEMEQVAKATELSGMRGVIARGLTEDGDAEGKLEDCRQLHRKWNGACDGRLRVAVAPHSVYTCSPEYISRIVELSAELDCLIHIHLSETRTEVENCLNRYGMTPAALADSVGVFDRPTLAAHCVHLTEKDMSILQKEDVHVLHNPSSNLKLASGFAEIEKMRNMGINICLGTDGASSNNNLNMVEEMHLASLIGKAVTGDPKAVDAYGVLEMATKNGARALGMEDRLGTIEPGMLADLILVDRTGIHHAPQNDVISSLVYCAQASDVTHVLVNGRILYENRHFINLDTAKIIDHAEESIHRLRQS